VDESNNLRLIGRKSYREDLALVCVGQQTKRLLTSWSADGDAGGSEWEEQRDEELNRRENKGEMEGKEIRKTARISQRDKLWKNLFCESGKSQRISIVSKWTENSRMSAYSPISLEKILI
jgi:hypothetical protein